MADKKPTSREMGHYLALAQIGAEMAVPVGLGVLFDIYVGTLPWGVVVGAVSGFILGLVHMIALVNRQEKTDSSKEKQDSA